MTYQELVPELPLRTFVNKVWFLEQPSHHRQERILPLPAHHFIINLSDHPYRVVRRGHQAVDWLFADGFISGLQSQYLVIENPPVIRHVGVELKPYGLAAFTSRPTSSFVGVVQTSEEALPGSVELAAMLRQAKAPDSCLELLLSFMAAHLRPDYAPPAYMEQSMQLLEQDKTGAQTAREIGISHKHLIKQWTKYCGITPKHYQNVLRLHKVLSWLDQAEKPVQWSHVVSRFSYCDQAHFIRTFRKQAGLSPREYARLLDKYPSGTAAFVALDNLYAGAG
jgi:AraC-like DNA-binding protein